MRTVLNAIETALVSRFRPNFLAVDTVPNQEKPVIHIVISATSFNKRTVDQRIAQVFNCLISKDETLVKENTIVVEAFTSSEMADIFEYIK